MHQEQPVRRKRRANLFTNDLRSLLYAFGDTSNPYAETVAVLEDILQEYIIDMCYEAQRVAHTANRQKIKVDDFKFALRHDSRKLGRVEELLMMQKDINEARKTFDNSEGKNLKNLDGSNNDNEAEADHHDHDDEEHTGHQLDNDDTASIASSSISKKKSKKERKRKREKERDKDNKDKEKEKDKDKDKDKEPSANI